MYKIYGHSQCPYCKYAIRDLSNRSERYEYKDVRTSEISMNEYSAHVQATGKPFKTVPLIMFDDKFIGGYDDLKLHLEAKELDDIEFDF